MVESKWTDKAYVLEKIAHNGAALQYASKELQADREVVLEAVKENGHALMFAPEELWNDPEVRASAGL